MSNEKLDESTKLLHPKAKPLMYTHTFPIFQTSTFFLDSIQQGADLFMGKDEGHIYSRLGNPTVELYEEMVRDLEGAVGTCAFGSGMGVSSSAFPFLKSGDHLIAGDTLYGCAISLFDTWARNLCIQVSFVDTSSEEKIKKAWKENNKMSYLETQGNPTCKISDICSIAKLCKEKKK